jgi:hypothetical protein
MLLLSTAAAVATNACAPPAGAPMSLSSLPLNVATTAHRGSGRAFTARRLSARPLAFHLEGFLSAEECEALIASATLSGLQTAETTGGTRSRRNCDVSVLSPVQESVVREVQRDAAELLLTDEALDLPGGGCEDLHVLRYEAGGQYLPHYDAYPRGGSNPGQAANADLIL